MDRKNMINPKFLGAAFVFFIIALAFANKAEAAVRCETQYGGDETCLRTGELQIDKEIFDTDNENYVDNLGFRGKTFSSNEEITFKFTVKNVGDETLFNIKVTDDLPSYLFWIDGFEGEYSIDKLNPGDSDERTFKARVVAESQLPADKSLVCTVNTAEVNEDGGEHDRDTAQFCIGKKVLGVSTLPKTGSNFLLIVGILTIISGTTGFVILRAIRNT